MRTGRPRGQTQRTASHSSAPAAGSASGRARHASSVPRCRRAAEQQRPVQQPVSAPPTSRRRPRAPACAARGVQVDLRQADSQQRGGRRHRERRAGGGRRRGHREREARGEAQQPERERAVGRRPGHGTRVRAGVRGPLSPRAHNRAAVCRTGAQIVLATNRTMQTARGGDWNAKVRARDPKDVVSKASPTTPAPRCSSTISRPRPRACPSRANWAASAHRARLTTCCSPTGPRTRSDSTPSNASRMCFTTKSGRRRTRIDARRANDDWNYGECDVCGQDGFCDIVGLVCLPKDPAALSVCYHCAIAGKYRARQRRVGKGPDAAKYPREVARNLLGIAKRGGAITKDTR